MMRVGQGFDVHALVAGRDLILGGVKIPHAKGLQGHSDADVLLHAVCDACLGAAGLGDIGRHFPDSEPRYKNIDSRKLVRHVRQVLKDNSWDVINVDATIIAQAPRLAAHFPAIACVNIKATTTERLGFAGREEGIAAQVVVMLSGGDSR